jgi:hypothetical protein
VNDDDKDKIKDLLKYALKCADNLDLQAVRDRIDHFNKKLNFGISNNDFLAELRTLRETFESGLKFIYFYVYPNQKAQILLRFGSDWDGIIKAFPDVRTEANCAVDLYALGHNTASVFHSMRVAEYGLRILAKERGIKLVKKKPVEWANWLDIIKALEVEAKIIGNKTAGAAKDQALAF